MEKLKEMNRTYDNADLFSLGKSHEGRQMYAIKVCNNSYTHLATDKENKMDYTFLGNFPPTPPLSQHYNNVHAHLLLTYGKMLA